MPNPIAKEPVIIQALAAIVVWAATRYGLNISDEQALQIAGGAFVVLAPFVRQLVTPTAKQQTAMIRLEEPDKPLLEPPVPRGGHASSTVRADELQPPTTGVRPAE